MENEIGDGASNDIDDILDDCLRAIEEDGVTPDECLARYPEHADELEPLLRVVLALRQSPRPSLSDQALRALETRLTTQAEIGLSAPTFDMDIQVEEYVRLPTASAQVNQDPFATTWRLVLVSSEPDHPPLGLEIYADVVVGRAQKEVAVDLDLTGYNGLDLGISRRHALLRPTAEGLLLLDLLSTTGTLCNGEKLRPGVPHTLRDGDTISFGSLHFKIGLVAQPDP